MQRLLSALWAAACLLFLAGALIFGGMFYALYWRYRQLFDDNGRYFDAADGVVYEDSSVVLIAPALLFLILAWLCALAWRKRRARLRAAAQDRQDCTPVAAPD